MASSILSTPGSLSLSLKVALISTALLSVAVILKLSVPVVTDFAVSEFPIMYSFFLSLLRPPYLYLVINGIIISIVASSKLQLRKPEEPMKQTEVISPPVPVMVPTNVSNLEGAESRFQDLNEAAIVVDDRKVTVADGGDEVAGLSKSVEPLRRSDSMELVAKAEKEKPLVSARFGSKKSVKATPEAGKGLVSLGVSKPKRQYTLESTWKMITDGRPIPLTRHLKKSDTWDTNLRRDVNTLSRSPPLAAKMKKSETFSDNSKSKLSENRQGSGKLRKEPSLSQDELNRRVEAFIKKFNEEMRLQRQESLNQYQEMLRRGAY